MKLIFLREDKHKTFQQIDTMTFDKEDQAFQKFPK